MNNKCSRIYRISAHDFKNIPGSPMAYWASKKLLSIFISNPHLGDISEVKIGMGTGKNDLFVRNWWEVPFCSIDFSIQDSSELSKSMGKYFPYNKGGDYRLWYGNLQEVLWYDETGRNKIKSMSGHRENGGYDYYFHKGITWSFISSSKLSVRSRPCGSLFDVAGSTIFVEDIYYYYVLAFLTSNTANYILNLINPTMNYQAGNIKTLPIILRNIPTTSKLSEENVSISKVDWDSFEISWDFQTHPFLIRKGTTIEESYNKWEKFTNSQYSQLKDNEEKLNKIFIETYELENELNSDVKDEDVTIRKADLERDIKSFISYAVGCMFGRYSIDKTGLILANSGDTIDDYKKKVPESRFEIDDDNIIPILDDDYFHDDIVSRFKEFLKTVYGNDTLEENMIFIAHALSPSSSQAPDMVIRDYFLKDFYADHLKIYQKRPIYWMFTSGKEQGFNALIYIHRYNKDILGKMWGDYLRELEAKLDAEISLIDKTDKKNTPRLVKLKKQRLELKEYDAELDIAASEKIEINLDDGVVINYAKFGKLLRQLK